MQHPTLNAQLSRGRGIQIRRHGAACPTIWRVGDMARPAGRAAWPTIRWRSRSQNQDLHGGHEFGACRRTPLQGEALRLGRKRPPLYVSAKRTHGFWRGKLWKLSNCDRTGYAGKICQANGGFVLENEPTGEGIMEGVWQKSGFDGGNRNRWRHNLLTLSLWSARCLN